MGRFKDVLDSENNDASPQKSSPQSFPTQFVNYQSQQAYTINQPQQHVYPASQSQQAYTINQPQQHVYPASQSQQFYAPQFQANGFSQYTQPNLYNQQNNSTFSQNQASSHSFSGLSNGWNQSSANCRNPFSPPPENTVPKIEVDFYEPHPEIASMSKVQVDEIRDMHNISLTDKIGNGNVYGPKWNPVPEFSLLTFPAYIHAMLRQRQFENPTPIQMQSWPVAYASNDLIGVAETGSGKTLAYLLPGCLHILAQTALGPNDGPVMLTLTPTRELADQIYKEALDFTSGSEIKIGVAYGGKDNRSSQQAIILSRPDIVIGTPGRLKDFVMSGVMPLNRVSYFVLDEADRLLDMGFKDDVKMFSDALRPACQRLMFSATWPKQVEDIALTVFNRRTPVRVTVGTIGDGKLVNRNIRQELHCVPSGPGKLSYLLNTFIPVLCQKRMKTLIFCNMKADCDHIGLEIRKLIPGDAISIMHGDIQQGEREKALKSFKSGRSFILIATDVASRGLDVDDISLVLNYSVPKDLTQYIHRIGRTGRAGKKGTSVSFLESNYMRMRELVNIVQQAPDHSIPDDVLKMINRR